MHDTRIGRFGQAVYFPFLIGKRQGTRSGQTHLISLFYLLILALIAVSKVLNSWRSGLKAASRGIPLAAALQTLPPGRRFFGVRWQAKRDTALKREITEPESEKGTALRCVCPDGRNL
jgi:hypothetical protein